MLCAAGNVNHTCDHGGPKEFEVLRLEYRSTGQSCFSTHCLPPQLVQCLLPRFALFLAQLGVAYVAVSSAAHAASLKPMARMPSPRSWQKCCGLGTGQSYPSRSDPSCYNRPLILIHVCLPVPVMQHC